MQNFESMKYNKTKRKMSFEELKEQSKRTRKLNKPPRGKLNTWYTAQETHRDEL